MVSVQHPAAATAFWSAAGSSHAHVFAFPAATASAQQVGSLVQPQWHHHHHHYHQQQRLPSSNGRSCVSVSSHALAAQQHHLLQHLPLHPSGQPTVAAAVGGDGSSGGLLGQALASSAAAFLAPQPAAMLHHRHHIHHQHPPPPPPPAPLSQVLMSPQTFPCPGATVLSLSPAASAAAQQQHQTVTTVDPEQPIGYGSFGVVWYVYYKLFPSS